MPGVTRRGNPGVLVAGLAGRMPQGRVLVDQQSCSLPSVLLRQSACHGPPQIEIRGRLQWGSHRSRLVGPFGRALTGLWGSTRCWDGRVSARFSFPPVRRRGSSVIRFSTSACLFLIEWKLTLTRREWSLSFVRFAPLSGCWWRDCQRWSWASTYAVDRTVFLEAGEGIWCYEGCQVKECCRIVGDTTWVAVPHNCWWV